MSSGTDTYWGIWLHAVRPLAELAALAATAESLGAAAVLVADEGTDRDLFVTLAALTQATRRVLLVGAVTNPHSRHPVASAAAFATLAEIAPGRIVAGYGAGGSRVLGPMGITPPRPYTALLECVEVVQALLRGETVHHTGEFSASGVSLPWAPRDLPLALAGRGPRVERLAAERADFILLAGRRVETVPSLVSRLRAQGRAARGRAPRIVWNPVAAWTEAMREELRAHLAYMAVDMPAAERSLVGLIPDAVLEQYAIVGDRDHVVRRLDALRREVRPEILAFDMAEYSSAFLESLASLALDAGAAVFHNLEALEMPHGLDSHD